MKHIDQTEVNINSGTRNKLKNFVTMIERFQVTNQTANAFELAEEVTKVTGIIKEYNKESTPEDIQRLENIEELLNGIKDLWKAKRNWQMPRVLLPNFWKMWPWRPIWIMTLALMIVWLYDHSPG